MLSLREARAVVGFGISGIFLSLDIACELVPKEMWLVDWLIGWWVDWLIGWLFGWLMGWLVDWSIDRSMDRSQSSVWCVLAFSRSLQESAGKLSSSLNFFWPFGPQLSCPTSTSSLQGPICAIGSAIIRCYPKLAGSVFTILCAYLFLETFGWRTLPDDLLFFMIIVCYRTIPS